MISLTVKTIDSASHSVSCLENATLLDLKKAIEASLNVPATNQRLIHAGRLLAPDSEIITTFGLSHGKVLHLVTRLPGVTSDQPPLRSTRNTLPRDARSAPQLTYSVHSIITDGNMDNFGAQISQMMRNFMTGNRPTSTTPRTTASTNLPPTATTAVPPTTSTSTSGPASTVESALPVPPTRDSANEEPTVYVVGNGMSSSLLFNHRPRRRDAARSANNTGTTEARPANSNVIFTRAVPLARMRGQGRTTTPQLQLARAFSLVRSIEQLLELPTTAPLDASISLPSVSEPSQEILDQFHPDRTNYSQALARIIDQTTDLERRVGDAMRWLSGNIRGEVWCADDVSRTSLQRASLLSANISYRLSQLHLLLFPLMANLCFENTQPGSADIVIPPSELPRRLAARSSSSANRIVGAHDNISDGTSRPSLLGHVDEIMFQTTFVTDSRGTTEPADSTSETGGANGERDEANTMEMAFQRYLTDLGMPGASTATPSGNGPTGTEARSASNPSEPRQGHATNNTSQDIIDPSSPALQESFTITMYPEIQLFPIQLQGIAGLPGMPSMMRMPGLMHPPVGLFGNRPGRSNSAANASTSVTGSNATPAVRNTTTSAAQNTRASSTARNTHPSDQVLPLSNGPPSSALLSGTTATRSTTAAGRSRRLSGFPTFIADMVRSAFTGSASANSATNAQSPSTEPHSSNLARSETTAYVSAERPAQHPSYMHAHIPITMLTSPTTTNSHGGPGQTAQSSVLPSENLERDASTNTGMRTGSGIRNGEGLDAASHISLDTGRLGALLSGILQIVDHSGADSSLRTMADVLLSGPEPSESERGTTSYLLHRIAQTLTIRDLQTMADGDLAPLQAVRGVVNSWIRNDFLRSEPLSEENLNQTAEYLAAAFVNSGDIHDMPTRLSPPTHSVVTVADIHAMTLNVSRDYFRRLVSLIVATHPGPPSTWSTFAPEITVWLRNTVEAWRTGFFALYGDDHVEARRVGRHVVAWFLTRNSGPLHDLMYEAALRLLSFLSSNIFSPDPVTGEAANPTGISTTRSTSAEASSLRSSAAAHSGGQTSAKSNETTTANRGKLRDDSNFRVRARQELDDDNGRLNARKKRKPTNADALSENDASSLPVPTTTLSDALSNYEVAASSENADIPELMDYMDTMDEILPEL